MFRIACALCIALAAHFAFFALSAPVENGPPKPAKTAEKPLRISLRFSNRETPSAKLPQKVPIKKQTAKKVLKNHVVPKPKNVKQDTKKIQKALPKKRASLPLSREPDTIVTSPQKRADNDGPMPGKIDSPVFREPIPIPSQNIRIAAMQHPVYPKAARRQGREGTVQIKVEILANGVLADLHVHDSSGSEDLDRAAIEAVRQWRFSPAIHAGKSVAQIAIFPVRFTLK